MAIEQVRPGPIGRLNQRRNGLRRLRRQYAVQQRAGHQQDFSLGRQSQGFKQLFEALGGEHALDAQAGRKRFSNQVGAFNAGQPAPFAARGGQSPAKLLQARILLTLYNANRHLSETIHR